MMGVVLETGLSHPVDQLILKLISTPFSDSEEKRLFSCRGIRQQLGRGSRSVVEFLVEATAVTIRSTLHYRRDVQI